MTLAFSSEVKDDGIVESDMWDLIAGWGTGINQPMMFSSNGSPLDGKGVPVVLPLILHHRLTSFHSSAPVFVASSSALAVRAAEDHFSQHIAWIRALSEMHTGDGETSRLERNNTVNN